jgi:hypothetical protein
MSCDSASSASANNIETTLPSFPDRGWSWQVPLSWLAGIALRCERRYQHRQLLELDDRLLADIGISRRHAVEEMLKSSWIRALMWHVYR